MSDNAVTLIEWLESYQHAEDSQRERSGMSAREIAEAMGWGIDRVRKELRRVKASIDCVWRTDMDISGRRVRIPTYTLRRNGHEKND